jgi:membrane-associated HD superfamily phosphohydrolase
MAKQIKNNESTSVGTIAAVGAGVIAVAAASYFFFGPEGKKNRHNLKGWMIKMKGEVIEKMEEAKDMTEAAYEKMVDAVAMKYAKAGKISEAEIRMFADMLKQQWKGIVKSHHKAAAAKTAVKTVAKKVKQEIKHPTAVKKAVKKSK